MRKRRRPINSGTCLPAAAILGVISWAVLLASLQLGRTTPGTVSLIWGLTFTGIALATLLLASISWWVLVRICSVAPGTAATRVFASCIPLLLSAPLLVALYRSDILYHYFVYNQIPRALAAWTPLAVMILLVESNLAFAMRLPLKVESWLHRDSSTPVLLFVAFLLLYVFTAGGHLYSPDESEMYQVTESMADGSLPLTHDASVPEIVDSRHLYSKYGLVTSVLGLPPYLIASAFGMEPDQPSAAFPIPNGSYPLVALLVNPLVTALTVVTVYLLARTLAFGKSVSTLVSLIYGLSTSSWVYSKTFFSQPPAALFLLGAAYFALRRSSNPVRDFALSGALLGLAAGSRIETLLVALPLAACLVRAFRTDRDTGIRAIIAFAVALTAFAGITTGWYNYVKTGSLLSTGHGPQGTLSGFSSKPYIGLFGSLFSSGFGLVTYNPVVVLGAVAFPLLALKRGFEARLFGAMVGIAIVLYGTFGDWSGGFTWANRYLVIILPFAILPVAMFFERPWRSTVGILLLTGASVLGVAVNLLAVLFDFNNGWLDLWDHGASVLQIQWDAHFSPIGAHVRLLGNFLATGSKLDLYILYKVGLPALIVFGLLVTFLITMVFRAGLAKAADELDPNESQP